MSYEDIMFEIWKNEQTEEPFIRAYLASGCDESAANAILWNMFINSTKSILANRGHWEVTVDRFTRKFEPFKNCDGMSGAAFESLQRNLVTQVFTSKFHQEAADWIAHHTCTQIEGFTEPISMSDRATTYRKSLEEFIDFKMKTDVPILGKDYYNAVWVWDN